jgi:dTDP-glucose pyrophosphorylase/CBS domain-containing protein
MQTLAQAPELSWRAAVLHAGGTIEAAIESLNASGLQIVLVVNGAGQLVGTVTDADIRRGLLRGLLLHEDVVSIMQRDPLVVPPQMERDTALQLMKVNRIHQLPIVDQERRVVGLHLIDQLMAPYARTNLLVIMAGGRGTRLKSHTEHCPKPLLPVAGKPILEHILERAVADGFTRFVISIHYLGHMIEEHFGSGEKWGTEITYLREQAPLGTAGALGYLSDLSDAPFLVSNGDVLTDVRYSELLDYHRRNGADATMAVRQHEWRHPYGVVRTDGLEIIGFEEKPVSRTHVNAGLYVLEPHVITALRPGEGCDMPTLFERLKQRGDRTIVYPLHELWVDVGVPEQYAEANTVFRPT